MLKACGLSLCGCRHMVRRKQKLSGTQQSKGRCVPDSFCFLRTARLVALKNFLAFINNMW